MADPDATAEPATNETLGGVDIELLTPLERAAGTGATDSTAALLAGTEAVRLNLMAADERPLRRTVLHWAAFGGNPDVVSAVLQGVTESATAAFISQQTGTSSHENAASGGTAAGISATVAAFLVKALRATCMGSPYGLDGMTPLHLAAEHGHAAAAVALLDAGAVDTYPNNNGELPLALAVEAGHEGVTLELVRRGALHIDGHIDSLGSTALHIAAWRGRLTIVELLLREGAAVNTLDFFPQQTALHRAVGCTRPTSGEIITALLCAGADVHAPDAGGETALLKAVTCTYPGPVIRTLMAKGANPRDDGNPCNISPVQVAVLGDHSEALSAMLELGVDPNTRTPFFAPLLPLPVGASLMDRLFYPRHDSRKYGGDSLLHLAARFLSVRAVEALLSAGAREDIPAFSAPPEDKTPISTLPADVIGLEAIQEDDDSATAIRSLLAGAELFRHGWLSVLRTRFDAGESLTGNTSGGSGSVEIPTWGLSATGKNEAGGEGDDSAQDDRAKAGDVVDGVWYEAAVWLATVPDAAIFSTVVEFL